MYHTLTKEEIYTALDERHSPETQKLLSAGNVAIAGLGGLGSNVAYALARIGVGHLHLIGNFFLLCSSNLLRLLCSRSLTCLSIILSTPFSSVCLTILTS